MTRAHMQWLAILFPAGLVGAYELVRHRWLEHTLGSWGNLAGSLIVGCAVYWFIRYYSDVITKAEQALGRSRSEAAVLAERHRIGREMHDSVAQALFHVRVKLRELGEAMVQPEQANEVARLEGQVSAAYDRVRAVISDLKRQAETEDTAESLCRAVSQIAGELGLTPHLDVTKTPRLTASGQGHLQAIVAEALTNARRHGGATTVQVSSDERSLVITDNGRGFDRNHTPTDSFGLMIMEERARMLGGSLCVDSALGRGTKITVNWRSATDDNATADR